jgi:hypothetical protein
MEPDDQINFDVFLKNNSIETLNNQEIQLLLDGINGDEKENLIKLYQVQGIVDTNRAIIKYVGDCVDRPGINLGSFQFKNHVCKFVSYLLSDIDIEEATNNSYMNMISIQITKDDNIMGIISLEFHTFEHLREKKTIREMMNKEISGLFAIFFKTSNGDKINKTYIGELKEFPEKRNLIYKLINFLSHKKVKYLFKKYT